MPVPSLPSGNYVEFSIVPALSEALYVSLVSDTQAYKLTQYQNPAGQTVYVAEVDHPSDNFVASYPLSTLTNQIDNTIGFYVKVFDGSPIAFTSGRLYFAEKKNAVPFSKGKPGSITATVPYSFDFVEFTVDPSTNQFNVDTSQVDQFGIPIYLQVTPVVPDYATGTGIVSTQTRKAVIDAFKKYAASSHYQAYKDVSNKAVTQLDGRLLAPQHVIDAAPSGQSATALGKSFDSSLDELFFHFHENGGQHVLYLVGNGSRGPEIFAGTATDGFVVKDHQGNNALYRVFQFKGTGYCYMGAGANPANVGGWGGATYQIFYPYYAENTTSAFRSKLPYTPPKAPYWFGGFTGTDQKYNLTITSAGRMVLGASGTFADDESQKHYYLSNGGLPTNFDHKMLGNLENQLCTMLNRGITPNTKSPAMASNLHLRTGSNQATDLIHADLSILQNFGVPPSTGAIVGASMSYKEDIMVPGGQRVWWNSLRGSIYFNNRKIQTFKVDAANIANPFILDPPTPQSANFVQTAGFVFDGATVSRVTFDWQSAVGINQAQISFEFQYGPEMQNPRYATLRLFSPYGHAIPYRNGDLGPTSGFTNGLVGATDPESPRSGMTMTGVSLNDPTYVYLAAPNANYITVYSPQTIKPINTNILAFSRFYPVDRQNGPIGQWNAYAAFFHIGDPAHGVEPPTVDGKGYAFAYDDNGGYSSDLTVQLPGALQQKPVVSTLTLMLLPW